MNHIVQHCIKIPHQNFYLKGLSNKDRHGDFVFHWQRIANARKKCLLVSISISQLHMATHNLWTYDVIVLIKWLIFSRSVVSNFTCICSCKEKNDLCFNVKNCININLNCLIDLALRMEFHKLFHSLSQRGKTKYLKLSVL